MLITGDGRGKKGIYDGAIKMTGNDTSNTRQVTRAPLLIEIHSESFAMSSRSESHILLVKIPSELRAYRVSLDPTPWD